MKLRCGRCCINQKPVVVEGEVLGVGSKHPIGRLAAKPVRIHDQGMVILGGSRSRGKVGCFLGRADGIGACNAPEVSIVLVEREKEILPILGGKGGCSGRLEKGQEEQLIAILRRWTLDSGETCCRWPWSAGSEDEGDCKQQWNTPLACVAAFAFSGILHATGMACSSVGNYGRRQIQYRRQHFLFLKGAP